MDFILQLFGYIVLVIAALIPIANPFSTAPLFISMTAELTAEQRKIIAYRATFYMFAILTIFLFLGALILSFFGISLSALRIAGGLIVATIGFNMLFDKSEATNRNKAISADEASKIAFTPLAMPMLSGPGSISVIMGMAATVADLESLSEQIYGYGVVTFGIAVSAYICWMVLRASGSVVRFLGVSGIDALTKIMGFLLVSIGVQFVITGITALLGKI